MSRRADYQPLADAEPLAALTRPPPPVAGLRGDLFRDPPPPPLSARNAPAYLHRTGAPSTSYQNAPARAHHHPVPTPKSGHAAPGRRAVPAKIVEEDAPAELGAEAAEADGSNFVVAGGGGDDESAAGSAADFGPDSRWNHVKDLDQFFARVYDYHQSGGFVAVLLSECCELMQFAFVVALCVFLSGCVDYDALFGRDKVARGGQKVTIKDVIKSDCPSAVSFAGVVLLVSAALFWLGRLAKAAVRIVQMWDVSVFFERALRIDAAQVESGSRNGSVTWHYVLTRLCQVQSELHLCIHKRDLTELDICQRILRHTNYLVALVNQSEKLNFGIPARLDVSKLLGPNVAPFVFFSEGLFVNLELLLFYGPGSPWENAYTLRPEYKCSRHEFDTYNVHVLTEEMQRRALWLGVANLLLFPFILLWQALSAVFRLAELVKRQPNALAVRKWSLFARHSMRHFNELEHELTARLNVAHRPASCYMRQFGSGVVAEILARNVALIAGAVFAVLLVLGAWDEDVLEVEHVLTVMTGCGLVVYACGVFIPEEHLVWCPEMMLQNVAGHVHYLDERCIGEAHTECVRSEFANLFPYRFYAFAEEVLSPVLTPLVLIFAIRPNCRKIVEFFHKNTISVPGAGDMCSFALMDLRRNGDKKYQRLDGSDVATADLMMGEDDGASADAHAGATSVQNDPMVKTTNGKVEMSLVRFAGANPNWRPAKQHEKRFLHDLKSKALHSASVLSQRNVQLHGGQNQNADDGDESELAMAQSIMPFVAAGQLHAPFNVAMERSLVASQMAHGGAMAGSVCAGSGGPPLRGKGITSHVGPLAADESTGDERATAAESAQGDSLLASLHQSGFLAPNVHSRYLPQRGGADAAGADQVLGAAALETSVHVMYLRHLVANRNAQHGAAVRQQQQQGTVHGYDNIAAGMDTA